MKSEPIGTQCKQEDESVWLGKLGASWLIHRRNSDEPKLFKKKLKLTEALPTLHHHD